MKIDPAQQSYYDFFREDFEQELKLKTVKEISNYVDWLADTVTPKSEKHDIVKKMLEEYYLYYLFFQKSLNLYECSKKTEDSMKYLHEKIKDLYLLWKDYCISTWNEPFIEWSYESVFFNAETEAGYKKQHDYGASLKDFIEQIEYYLTDERDKELVEYLDSALLYFLFH